LIDPASAIGLGAGAGGALGLIVRLLTQMGQNKLDALKENNRHAEANNSQAQKYRKELLESSKLDKGEPYKYRILWGLWEGSGTAPDRLVPPPYSFELRMLTSAYCLAIAICFLCGDVVVFSRDIEGATNGWSFLFGIIERTAPDRAIYVQTLAGLGAGLLTTASFVITSTIVGFSRRS
jgi:hypothetical protein